MSYCIYLRKSRADFEAEQRGEGETLARHRSILTKLAAKNHHPIGHIYQEIVSGETIADRPQVQALLSDVAAHKWQGVYVMEVERLARGDTMDQGLIAHAFKAGGTYIISPAKTYNPADPADEEYFEFSLFMSRREYKTINRRMQGGRVQSAREGKYICSRPAYGYRKVKLENDKGYTLAICPEEAAVVRQVFDWYLNGVDGEACGLVRIARRLLELHIPFGEQGSDWRPCRIHRMLTNPVYIGMIQWGKNKTVRTVSPTGVEKKRVMQPAGELYPGLHQPIVDADTYNAVQEKLHQPRAHVPMRSDCVMSNPLSGLIFCEACGHQLTGLPASGRQPAILKCRTFGCPTVQNYRTPVEKAVLATVKGWITDGGAIVPAPAARRSGEDALNPQALAGMEVEKEKLLRQIEKLQDLVEQEVYTVDQYNQRYAVLHDRLNVLDADLNALRQRINAQAIYCTPEELKPAIVYLLEHYHDSAPEQQNSMLRACVSKVVYHKRERGSIIRGVQYADPSQFELDVYPKLK